MNTIANRFVLTANSATVMLGSRPYCIAKTDAVYEEVVALIKAKATEAEVLAVIEAAAAKLTAASQITPNIRIDNGVVTYKGQAVANSLTERMLQMLNEGFDLVPMANFLENLMQNPSYTAVKELYLFIEKGNMPITPDGYFMAYKAVRADFKDIHSGTIDNSVGAVCEMPRHAVDDNRDRTCSYGLHFCSFEYLPYFANADGHVMLLKINPRDVVSIPADYKDTKGRCCRYEVVGEHEGYYTDRKPYFTTSVFNTADLENDEEDNDEEDNDEEDYEVYMNDDFVEKYSTLEEARSEAIRFFSENDNTDVEVRNAAGEVLVSLTVN